MTDLTNRTALITGSARGIGKAVALRYASLGANIPVNYSSDETGAAATVAEIRGHGARDGRHRTFVIVPSAPDAGMSAQGTTAITV